MNNEELLHLQEPFKIQLRNIHPWSCVCGCQERGPCDEHKLREYCRHGNNRLSWTLRRKARSLNYYYVQRDSEPDAYIRHRRPVGYVVKWNEPEIVGREDENNWHSCDGDERGLTTDQLKVLGSVAGYEDAILVDSLLNSLGAAFSAHTSDDPKACEACIGVTRVKELYTEIRKRHDEAQPW